MDCGPVGHQRGRRRAAAEDFGREKSDGADGDSGKDRKPSPAIRSVRGVRSQTNAAPSANALHMLIDE